VSERASASLFVVDSAPSGAASQYQVAKWVAAEARARGLHAQLMGSDGVHPARLAAMGHDDVVLMILQRVLYELEPEELMVPWERWSDIAGAVVEQGATLILVAAGAPAAGVAACLRRGARAVVEVDVVEDTLDVIQKMGIARLHSAELRTVLPSPFAAEHLDRLRSLTTIELRVLFHLTKGYPADRIASAQRMSLSTVRAHIRSIFRKLGVKSQLAAVALANGTAAADLDAGDDVAAATAGSRALPGCLAPDG
jgi:DNA-binding CsgD family transcriptional regulator